jgi:integrase
MNRSPLPPNLSVRQYQTADGRTRVIYRIRFTDWKGVRRSFPAGDQLQIAKDRRNEILGLNVRRHDFDQGQAQQQGVRLVAWSGRWLRLKQGKRSLAKDRISVARLTAFFGDCRLDAISTGRTEEYKQWRCTQTTKYGAAPKPATINRELACLRSLLTFAGHERILDHRPVIRLFEEHNERRRTASTEEYLALRSALPAHVQPILLLLWDLGPRISELVSLTWPQVDLTQEVVLFPRTKTEDPRAVPLSPAGKSLFFHLWDQRTHAKIVAFSDRVFVTPTGKPISRFMFYAAFRQACRRLGITGLWTHDLRGTFATRKVREGYDRKFVKAITGHKTDAVFDRYVRPSVEDLRRVVADPVLTPQKRQKRGRVAKSLK